MNIRQQILVIFATVAAIGLVGILAVDIMMTTNRIESAAAWHAAFDSKKECRIAVIEAFGNKTGVANRICERSIPH